MSNESSMKKCVDCGQTGHTSTACNNGKVGIIYLFGVRIDPTAVECEDDGLNYEPKSLAEDVNINKHDNERNSRIDVEDLCDEHSHDKKKGVPWTEEEHKAFLIGLEQLGRGQWRAISKNFVPSRTPTQVASHAQKFYIRLKSTEDKRKRRTSLFDIPLDEYSRGPGASVRPPAAPMAGTYGVEGYNRFPDMIGYNRNEVHIPLMSYMYDESAHPLNQSTERFSTLVSRPLLKTNAKRWSTQEPELE